MKKKTNEQFVLDAEKIHGDKYEYLTPYKDAKTKVKIRCKVCNSVFFQTPNNHLSKKNGCPYCLRKHYTTSSFKEEAEKIHSDKYEYLEEYKNMKTKLKIRCKVCGSIFFQIPEAHLRGQGCPKCGIAKNSKTRLKKDFIEEAKKIHPDFDYSKVEYKGVDVKVKIICPKGHEFFQTPYKHLNFYGCPYCNSSSGEQTIISYLSKKNIEFEFQKKFENCKDKMPLPFDFYLPKQNLLIEYQGEQHYKPNNKFGGLEAFEKTKFHDSLKKEFAKNSNIKLLTIPYTDDIIQTLMENL